MRAGVRALALALGLLAGARPAAAFDRDAALAKAHALTPALMAADAAPLWREFDANMRAALRDSANLAGVLRGIVATTGRLDSVLSEDVASPRESLFVYRAVATFHAQGEPWTILFAFDAGGRISGMFVRPVNAEHAKAHVSAYLDYATKTPLHLPFRGEWDVFWGGHTIEQNYHAAYRDQRFAHDVLIFRKGRSHEGDGTKCADYYCYGQEILAPAAGTVVWRRDSLPDNVPGVRDPVHALGNSLILDHGDGEYSVIAHLQPGSVRFALGGAVPAGAVVGLCGNSGNTSEPHLHYHLQNGPRPFDADGLPVQFVDLVVDGRKVEKAEILRGQRVRNAP